jgi:hypothetical protein
MLSDFLHPSRPPRPGRKHDGRLPLRVADPPPDRRRDWCREGVLVDLAVSNDVQELGRMPVPFGVSSQV